MRNLLIRLIFPELKDLLQQFETLLKSRVAAIRQSKRNTRYEALLTDGKVQLDAHIDAHQCAVEGLKSAFKLELK